MEDDAFKISTGTWSLQPCGQITWGCRCMAQ